MRVNLRNMAGMVKRCKLGFSRTMPFFYIKIYIQGLLENGYEPLNEIDRQQLIARKIIVD